MTAQSTADAARAAAEVELQRRFEQAAKAAMDQALSSSATDDPLPTEQTDSATWGDDITRAARSAVSETLIGQADAEPVEPLCADVETWVAHIYCPTYIRRISQTVRWCPRWWLHAEAIVRLTAMWRSWEAARLADDPDAIARWLRDVLDPLNRALLDLDGPFSACSPQEHTDPSALPLELAPAGYWDIHSQQKEPS